MFITVKSNYGLNQSGRIVLKTPQSPPFEVAEEKALELERRGIAVLVPESSPEEAGEVPVNWAKLKLDELKALANERGIEGADGMKKAELVEALSAQTEEGESDE